MSSHAIMYSDTHLLIPGGFSFLYMKGIFAICIICGKKYKKTSKNGRQLICGTKITKNECWQKLRMKYRKKYNLIHKERVKEYKREHNRRKRIEGKCNGIACRTRFETLLRDNFTCQYCGRKAPDVILHVDHKFPKSKGGSYEKNNLITACMDCNLGKSNLVV